jgi:hypothetical protein
MQRIPGMSRTGSLTAATETAMLMAGIGRTTTSRDAYRQECRRFLLSSPFTSPIFPARMLFTVRIAVQARCKFSPSAQAAIMF